MVITNSRLKLSLEFMRGSFHYLALALVCMAVSIAGDLLAPLFLSFIVDSVLADAPSQLPAWMQQLMFSLGNREWYMQHLWVLGVMLVLIQLICGVFVYLRGYLSTKAGESIAKRTRDQLYDHLQRWPFSKHVNAETGDLIQRCSTDVDTTRRFLSSQLVDIFRIVFIVIFSLAVLIPISVPLTLATVALIPLIMWYSARNFAKMTDLNRIFEDSEGELLAMLQENLTGVRVVRAFGRQSFELDKFQAKNNRFTDLLIQYHNMEAGFWGKSDFLCAAQVLLSTACAAYVAIRGELSIGAFLIFLTYANRLVWPIRSLTRSLSQMSRAFIALERIEEILHSDMEQYDEDKQTPALSGDIVFEHVSFGYDSDQKVLEDVSFRVPAGKTVAILGATGSGKSSMMLLLQRLYDIDSGLITIGGVDIRDISKKHLRSRIGIIMQEPFLYSRTIQGNIGIVKPDADKDQLHMVAEIAEARGFIEQFELGYDTVVGERGVTLSGGQKQRVAIARTLLKDNDILVFDDSLSAVDNETDAAIRARLQEQRRGVTTFIISHRLTTLQEADFILVFENGRVAAQGTHSELIAQEGLYSRIYRIQSSWDENAQKAGDSNVCN